MDGFIDSLPPRPTKCWTTPTRPECDVQLGPQGQPDVMSTQRRAAIPNYWAYADHYALQDADVRAGRLLDAALAPVPGVGVVGRLLEPERPDVVPVPTST